MVGETTLPTASYYVGDATAVTARAGEGRKPKHADELAWPTKRYPLMMTSL